MHDARNACLILLLIVLSTHQHIIYVRALSAPNGLRLRVDTNGNPRLASLVGSLISVGTRVGLCARSVEQLSVRVDAKSNRDVLRGDLKEVSIRVKNSRGPFLRVSELDIRGSDLNLGLRPLMYTTFPLAWLILRPPPLLMISCLVILLQRNRSPISRGQSKDESLASRFQNKLGGSPCTIDYSVTLSDDNVAKSKWLQLALRLILRSLMVNSVLGVAAAAADTMTILSNASDLNQPEMKRSPNQLLPGTASNIGSSQQSQVKGKQQNQPPYLTKLLDATSFELVNAKFSKGKILLDAEAVFPDGKQQMDDSMSSSSSTTSRSRLAFTLRTTPKAHYDEQQHALAFDAPECRFSVGTAMGSALFRKTFPDWNVWLPVGPGVAITFGTRHRVRTVNVTDGSCRVSGRVSLFGKEKIGLGIRLEESIARAARLPLGIGESPKALPFASNDSG